MYHCACGAESTHLLSWPQFGWKAASYCLDCVAQIEALRGSRIMELPVSMRPRLMPLVVVGQGTELHIAMDHAMMQLAGSL